MRNPKDFLEQLFHIAIEAAHPKPAMAKVLPEKPKGRTIVIGAGKGAAQMAKAFEELWDGPVEGVVVTRYGYACETQHIKVLEASHPVPDPAGMEATAALRNAVQDLTEDDLVIALICGGGSALLPAPPDGLTLGDEQDLNRVLLASGAPISVMNAIRTSVSTIKGGKLAALAKPAQVVSFVVSDVPGDDPAQVASGPTVASTSVHDPLQLAASYGISLPTAVIDYIRQNGALAVPDTSNATTHVIASAALSLEAAADFALRQGVTPHILSDAIEGEARDIGMMHAALAREIVRKNRPFQAPCLVLSGGETTVTLGQDTKGARGGRNTEFLLSFALGIEGVEGIVALAADTDGIDGSEDNAGAFADGSTILRLRDMGHDPQAMLNAHDAWGAFDAVGDIFAPGPTGTNVNDFRALLIL